MSMRLFQDSCAYVGRKCHLLEGLTTKQTLYYAAHLTIGTLSHLMFLKYNLNNPFFFIYICWFCRRSGYALEKTKKKQL